MPTRPFGGALRHNPVMFFRVLRAAYHRLGHRYPKAVVLIQFQLAYVIVLAGVALLALYQDMSHADWVRILVAAEALMVVENFFSGRLAVRMLDPATRWLKGPRTQAGAVEAWRALVDLPVHFAKRRWLPGILFNAIPWCVYATLELELPFYGAAILFAGGMVVMAYGLVLRFLALELSLRPAVEDVSRALPDGAALGRVGIPLRWKLLAGMPLINVITGVVVSGLSTDGSAQLDDLGFDVIVAVAVAFSISLELTVLLSKSILAPLQNLRTATKRVGQGDFGARVPILSTDETGALSRAFNDTIAGLQERERLREAFGAFVDPEVAERVLREGTVLHGEEVEVTVLFLDIRSFTAFAERSSAREVVDRLNEFYETVVPVLLKHGGHANKFVGDGLLGVFGAPDRQEDHADRAVSAACEIASLVADRYGDDLRIGIGVNSGPVVAGTIGGGGRVEFTVIGDPVNTAARVEEVTRETNDDILITEATRCLLLREHVAFEEREPAELKGKTERVRLWAPRRVEARPLDERARTPGTGVALSAAGDPAAD